MIWRLAEDGTWHLPRRKAAKKASAGTGGTKATRGPVPACGSTAALTRIAISRLPERGTICPRCRQAYQARLTATPGPTPRQVVSRPAKRNNAAFHPVPVSELTEAERRRRRAEAAAELAAQERRERTPGIRSAGSPGLGKRR